MRAARVTECGMVNCGRDATQVVTYSSFVEGFRKGVAPRRSAAVCLPCAESYAGRPELAATFVPIDQTEWGKRLHERA